MANQVGGGVLVGDEDAAKSATHTRLGHRELRLAGGHRYRKSRAEHIGQIQADASFLQFRADRVARIVQEAPLREARTGHASRLPVGVEQHLRRDNLASGHLPDQLGHPLHGFLVGDHELPLQLT